MAKSLLKNYFMAIVAVVMIVGFSAFKVVENSKFQPADGWYELYIESDNPTDYNKEENQLINSNTPSTPDGINCDITNLNKPCMAYLIFPTNYTGPLLGESVENLVAFHGVTLSTNPYARRVN